MSRENVEVVRAVVRSWEADEIRLEYFDPDVEWIAARSGIEGAFRGHAGMLEFRADTVENFEKFELHFELLELGERVLAWGTIRVRGRDSGIEMDVPVGVIFDFRDGRIARWQDFGSKQQALAAAGLTER
jgi:ketosteroid isomerase-like protein